MQTNTMKKKSYQESIDHYQYEPKKGFPEWLELIRKQAHVRYQELGFPSQKHESWKYVQLRHIAKQSFLRAAQNNKDKLPEDAFKKFHLALDEANRFTFYNGLMHETASSRKELPEGVVVERLSDAIENRSDDLKPYLGRSVQDEENAFAAINTFQFSQGLYIYVPKGIQVDLPIHLLVAGEGDESSPVIYYPRMLVVLGEDAQLNLISDHVSVGDAPYFANGVAEVFLGKGAKIHWVALQRQSQSASHFLKKICYLGENSTAEIRTFVHGSNVTFKDIVVNLEGENSSCDVRGLSLLEGHSQVGHRVWAHHKASQTTSRQVFKNILADHSQAEFNSMAFVHKETLGSNSDQLNRNLILSDDARAYSRPQLRIDSDDVAAAHGSATGQLSENEVFYLRSRGLEEKLAKHILTYGFAEEILETIKPDQLRWQLELLVRKEIEAVMDPERKV